MQRKSSTAAPFPPRSPRSLVIDPQAHISRHVARRTAELVCQARIHSVDGHDARTYRAYREAGVRLPRPRLVRGTVAAHRLELSRDDYGRALGRCDCKAAGFGLLCSHLLALAVHAITLGWTAA
jgi:hypothetical protein